MDAGFSNPPATADVPARRVTRIVTIAAPVETVWAALSDPEHIAGWLGDIAVFLQGVQPGATGRIAWTGEIVLATRILDVEPQRLLRFEWSEGILRDEASRVTFTLRPDGTGTQVHVEEAGFTIAGGDAEVLAKLRQLAQGWTVEVDELVDYAERLGRD